MNHRKGRVIAWIGGVVACLVLIGVGVAYIAVGVNAKDEVTSTVSREQIVGTPDMTPALIREEVEKAGLQDVAEIPSCSIAGQHVTNGDEARCFADYMRIHALLSSEGQTYAQMGQFLTADGTPTSDATKAAIDPQTHKPVQNAARQTWVTETALTTGLNMAFFAEQVSYFSIIMGVCMVVIGIGLGVLAVFALGVAPWRSPGDSSAGVPAPE